MLSPQPYPIPRSHLLSGMRVRGFKQNPRSRPSEPGSLPRERPLDHQEAHSRKAKDVKIQPTVDPHPPSTAAFKFTLSWRYGPAIIPYQLGAGNWLFLPILTFPQKTSKIDPSAGPYQRRGKQSTLFPCRVQTP